MASPSGPVSRTNASRGFIDSEINEVRQATGPATTPAAQQANSSGQARRSSSVPYGTERVPFPLMSKPVPPAVHELTKLLDRQQARPMYRHLQMVEQTLLLERGGFDLVPDSLLRAAHRELQMLVRKASPTPALARLLDMFERRLIEVEIRSFIERTGEQPKPRNASVAPGYRVP